MNATVLVVGGAGYIGSHCAKQLARRGYDVVVLDNLSRGHAHNLKWGTFEHGDTGDSARLREVFARHDVAAVVHFAAHSVVSESVANPQVYFENNVGNALHLLAAMREASVSKFIFSSTAAVYGEPMEIPIAEHHPAIPINPYGQSKFMVEQILSAYGMAYGIEATSFRYFNAAGADPEGELGEEHHPETHLIPRIIASVSGGDRLQVFGTDYPTPDGTCIRDYIHVTDLAEAHLLGLERLLAGQPGSIYNLGNGAGYSNFEVLLAVERVSGQKVPYDRAPRREGDPARLVGAASKAIRDLGWKTRHSSLDHIVETAWRWHDRDRRLELGH